MLSWGRLVNQSASSCEIAPSFIPYPQPRCWAPAQANSFLTGLTALVSPSTAQPALCRQVNLPQTPLSRCSWLRTCRTPPAPQPHPGSPRPARYSGWPRRALHPPSYCPGPLARRVVPSPSNHTLKSSVPSARPARSDPGVPSDVCFSKIPLKSEQLHAPPPRPLVKPAEQRQGLLSPPSPQRPAQWTLTQHLTQITTQ